MKKVLMNWSGGKDSSLCLYHLMNSDKYEVIGLLTSVNDKFNRVSMHGVRETLIKKQAKKIGIPLHLLRVPGEVEMDEYNELMLSFLHTFKEKGIEYCVFGDIFLEDLRSYREEKLKEVNMKGLFPLWKKSTQKLAIEFINMGFKAVLSSLDGNKLDKVFIGRSYDNQLLTDLPDAIDPCGENGEFHTFVYDGPIFESAVNFEKGEVVEKIYKHKPNNSSADTFSRNKDQTSVSYWFMDFELKIQSS